MEKNRWLQPQFQDLNVNILAQQQQMFKQQYEIPTKKGKGSQIGVQSKMPSRLEAAMKGKKTRSYALISSDEIFEKWEKGLCELCDELYVPGHKCKKVSPNYVIVVVDEKEDLMQSDFGVKNHPTVDAPQVFDKSPGPNLDEGKQQGNAHPPPDENSGLFVLEEFGEDANPEMRTNEEALRLVVNSKALDLTTVRGQPEVPFCPEKQDEDTQVMEGSNAQVMDVGLDGLMPLARGGQKCWFHGGKEVNGFSLLVFDPGKSGVGQGTPKPTSLVFMYAWLGEVLAASKMSVVRLVFDPGEEMATTIFSSDLGKLVAWHTSAQMITEIAVIKGPREEWPDLIGSLLNNITQADSSASLKQTTLETLGLWSSIYAEEIEIQDSYDLQSGQSEPPHSHLIRKALPFFVSMLLETLLKQEDRDQDDSIWNLSMAGGTCLILVARIVGDAIVPLVMPFVEANTTSSEWRCREAAMYALGSILEGPSIEKLFHLVQAGSDLLLKAMRDQNNHVKDSTAWTLSRLFELLHFPSSGFLVISPANLQQVLGVLLEGIEDAPNVAEKVGGAIYYLAQGFEDVKSSSFDLTPCLTKIIISLIATSGSTLNKVVRCATVPKIAQLIQRLLLAVMNRMSRIFDPPLGKEKQRELPALLCDVLQVIIHKFSNCDKTRHIVLQLADQIMVLFLKILACCSSTVHEEAMFAMGALAYATGSDFGKYMPEFCKNLDDGVAGGWFTAHVSSCGPFHITYHSAPESVNSELRTMDSQLCQDDMQLVRRSAASNLAKLVATVETAHLKAKIMSMLEDLRQDDHDYVRLLAVDCCAHMLPVSHIHDLEFVRVVFNPGGKIISSYIGSSPSAPGATADMDEAGLIAVEILAAFKLAMVRLMFDPGGEFSAMAAEFLKLEGKLLEGGGNDTEMKNVAREGHMP